MNVSLSKWNDTWQNIELPGWQAQRRMSVREDAHLRQHVPVTAKKAGVLVPITCEEIPSVVLIKRQTHQKDHHSGQLSLPGGKFEKSDQNILQTAIRETHEEIGLHAQDYEIVGNLSPLYIPVSNFHVFPHVAVIKESVKYQPEEAEVEQVLHLDIRTLFKNPVTRRDLTISNGFILKQVPYFPLDNHIVWGATAMILAEFAHVLASSPNFADLHKNNLNLL